MVINISLEHADETEYKENLISKLYTYDGIYSYILKQIVQILF